MWEAATIFPHSCKLTFDLLILKVVSKSRVTWTTPVPILVFLGHSVLDLGPMYVTDRRQTAYRLMPPTRGLGHNNINSSQRNKNIGNGRKVSEKFFSTALYDKVYFIFEFDLKYKSTDNS